MASPDTSTNVLPDWLEKMVAHKQLSAADARSFARKHATPGGASVRSEEEILRWLAQEYGLTFTTLEEVELEKEVLSLFPARLLLKGELLPLRRTNGSVEIATSRLFATQELDALRSLSGLKLKPVLAPTEAIQREMKKRL